MTEAVRTGAHEERVLTQGELVADIYEVRSLLGSGGMGEVYEAQDRSLNRRVALKVVRPSISADYLLREGRALAAIHHPGVVTVHTMGLHRGISFLVLERVLGLSLDRMAAERRVRGERFTVAEVLDMAVAVAETLSIVHRAGLVHRDIKPGNVMLAPGGRVVLMDFGLVLPNADRAGHRSVAGSLDYMAPEALCGEVTEGEAPLLDIYGLGVLIYELLTGVLPFDSGAGGTVEAYRVRMQMSPVLSLHRTHVPKALSALLVQLLAADPNERPQSAEAALWQLRGLRARLGSGPEERPFSVVIVDDDADVRSALALYVRAAVPDAEIETAQDGQHAIRAVRRQVPDLMLLDLDLPDMNGIEVCMLLRGMKLGDSFMIVSVSGRASKADVELLQQLGVRSLEKGPNLMTDLMQVVRGMRPA